MPDADRAELERRARDRGAPARVAERARIVLLAAEGLTGAQIAERAGCTEPTVVKWRSAQLTDLITGHAGSTVSPLTPPRLTYTVGRAT